MLCLFAQHFPRSVATLLQRGQTLKRRFREETVTDLLMANLLALGGGSILVDFPDEPTTGADMEWNFINRDTREHFQILLQAKRVYEADPDWRLHRYKELFYRSGPLGILQVDTLCRTARTRSNATYPGYIFYNLASTCRSAHTQGAINLLGVNLSDASAVQMLAASSTSKKLEKLNSAVGALYPFFFSLADIFCPSNVQPLGPMALAASRFSIPMILSLGRGRPILGRSLPPRPDQVRERLVEQRRKILEIFQEIGISIELPEIPEVSKVIPPELEPLIDRFDREPISSSPPISFWRATFISMNPTDELGRSLK